MRTLADAAALLGLSPSTLRSQVRNGKLRVVRRYGRDLVTDRELERYRQESLGRVGRYRTTKETE